jgi:hypothetical protein
MPTSFSGSASGILGGGGWPTHADVMALLYEGGRAIPAPDAILEAGIDIELPRVIAFVEGPPARDGTGGTGRSFTATVEQRLFDGSGTNALNVFDLVPADQGGSAIAVVTMPGSGAIAGVPLAVLNSLTEGWDLLTLQWDGVSALPRFPLGRRNIGVSATWGYRATVPEPLVAAVAAEVARLVEVGSQVALAGAGETKSIGSYSINTSAGVSVWPQSSPIGVNHERFTEAMKMYRDPRALDRVRFGPAATRALWGW